MSSHSRRSRRNEKSKKTTARRGSDGRLRLRIIEDKPSGQTRIELKTRLFLADWQNRMTEAAANTVYALLSSKRDVDSIADLGVSAMISTSKLVDHFLAHAPEGALACRSGCAHCCHQSVGVTPPEALAIHRHVRATFDPDARERLRTRINALAETARQATKDQRLSPDLPCPFLVEQRCSIYEVRPLSCRGVNSLDAGICEKKLTDPETRRAYFDGSLPGHSFLEPARSAISVSAGMQLCLSELFGLDMRPLDLALALQLLLESPNQADAWLTGAAALSQARGGEVELEATRNLAEAAGLVAPAHERLKP